MKPNYFKVISISLIIAFSTQQISYAIPIYESLATNREIHGPKAKAVIDVENATKLLADVIRNMREALEDKDEKARVTAITAIIDLRRGITGPNKTRQELLALAIEPGLIDAWIIQATTPLAMATTTEGEEAPISLREVLAEKEGFSRLSQFFRNRLEAVGGDTQALVADFESTIADEARRSHKSRDSVRQRVLGKLCYLAEPGAPFKQPPDSWQLIANYLYLRLQRGAIDELRSGKGIGKALQDRLNFIAGAVAGKDVTDPEVRKEISRALKERFSDDDAGVRDQIRFNYDSLYHRNDALYLSVDIMPEPEKNLEERVKSDLLISIPRIDPRIKPEYEPPYQLTEVNIAGRKVPISLFDPLDFLKKNFRGRSLEAGLVSQRDIYEAWQAEFREAMELIEAGDVEAGMERLHTMLRVSFRAVNASEAGRGFLLAIVKGNTVLLYHLVFTYGSERGYTNMTAITGPANLIRSIFKEGMLGLVLLCIEADHNRVEADTEEEEEHALLVIDEIVRSGVLSGITIDTTKKINTEGKTPAEKFGEAIRFARKQLVRLKEGLEAQEKASPGSVFFPIDRWYVEIDLAPDLVDHTPDEARYIAEETKKLGEEFGCAVNVVPGIGFTHGDTAAELKIELLGQLADINRSVLGENTGIASHAGSGLGHEGVRMMREKGAFVINKSTEFGNMLLAVLRDSEVASDRDLYREIWDAIFDWYVDEGKEGKIPADVREAVLKARKEGQDYERPYDYDEVEGTWLVTDQRSKWLAAEQRQWTGLRDKHGRLVFHNRLVWGISEEAWKEYARLVEMTLGNYHRPEVMNGDNMAPVVRGHIEKNWATLGQTVAYAGIERPFAIAKAPARAAEEGLVPSMLYLDAILTQATQGERAARLRAIELLKRVFQPIEVTRTAIPTSATFPGARVVPDLSPATSLGVVAVDQGDLRGSGDGVLIDMTSAAPMRLAIPPIMRVAKRNWLNVGGEGRRHNVPDEAQIPPGISYIVSPDYSTVETINDPVDGTSRTARGEEGGVSIVMAMPAGGIKLKRPIPDEVRAENWIYPGRRADISLKDDSPEEIIKKIAMANNKKPSDYQVWPLYRPYADEIVQAAGDLGATVRQYGDGTVQATLYSAAHPEKNIIIAGRIGSTEFQMICPPLLNIRYPDGTGMNVKGRIISENSGYEVVEVVDKDTGEVYYTPRLDDKGKKITSNKLINTGKLSLNEIKALRKAGYPEDEIEQIKNGEYPEFELQDVAFKRGDIWVSYLTEPMLDIDGEPLYEWGLPIQGVQETEDVITAETLEFGGAGLFLVKHTYPNQPIDVLSLLLHQQERVLDTLSNLLNDPDEAIRAKAQEVIGAIAPYMLSLNLQHEATQRLASLAEPVIVTVEKKSSEGSPAIFAQLTDGWQNIGELTDLEEATAHRDLMMLSQARVAQRQGKGLSARFRKSQELKNKDPYRLELVERYLDYLFLERRGNVHSYTRNKGRKALVSALKENFVEDKTEDKEHLSSTYDHDAQRTADIARLMPKKTHYTIIANADRETPERINYLEQQAKIIEEGTRDETGASRVTVTVVKKPLGADIPTYTFTCDIDDMRIGETSIDLYAHPTALDRTTAILNIGLVGSAIPEDLKTKQDYEPYQPLIDILNAQYASLDLVEGQLIKDHMGPNQRTEILHANPITIVLPPARRIDFEQELERKLQHDFLMQKFA